MSHAKIRRSVAVKVLLPSENRKPVCSGTPAARRAASVWLCGQGVTRML